MASYARTVASEIDGCRLAVLNGNATAAWAGEIAPVIGALTSFLEETVPTRDATAKSRLRSRGALRTLLFTDLESSTALTQSLGDARAQEVLRGHNDAVRAALEAHGGEEVKHTGDGIFGAFGSAVSAD